MVAGDVTMHREVEVQEGFGSAGTTIINTGQMDMAHYTDLITLKVRDLDGVSKMGPSAILFTYPEVVTIQQFVDDAAARFNVPSNKFELVYQDLQRGEIYEFSSMPPEERLTALNIMPNKQREYLITLERKKVKKIKNVVRRLDAELDAVTPNQQQEQRSQPMSVDVPITVSRPGNSRENFVNVGREFVGLKNMTMTCYLNSLIQSLFFTPELRNAVYMYQYVDDIKKKKSIAFALQKLFLQLQFSVRDSIGTEEITHTFGWKGEEVWIQHDIEELYRLLMEHLSEEFKSTPLQGILAGLYGGILNDYVQCLECKNRNCKEELFLALPLPVRVFGSPLNAPTLEEALRAFIVPEILDEKNQYNCERCQKPCDAKKGFSFKKLPYILTIALKRFEFNWERLTRHKLNDKVIFPNILDMNDMVDTETAVGQPESELVPPIKPELVKAKDDGVKRDAHSRPAVNLNNFTQDAPLDEGIDVQDSSSSGNNKDAKQENGSSIDHLLAKGPNVYQLYAILIHRGGVSGGHYFAFIRDLETQQWYRFDDTTVRRISDDDIQGTYGGADSYLDGGGKDIGVAYMLVYRRYDPALNALPLAHQMLPEHIKEMWEHMKEQDKNVHNQEELDRNTVRMNVYIRIPGSLEVLDYREMTLLKASTMQEAAIECYNEFFKDESPVVPDRVRLVRFDRDLSIIENSFDGKDEEIVCIAIKSPVAVTKMEGLLLQVREPTETFESYSQDDVVFITHLVNTQNEDFVDSREVHVQPNETIGSLRKKLAGIFCRPENEIFMIAHKPEREIAPVILLGDEKNDMAVSSLNFPRVTKMYVECFKPGEDSSHFVKFITNYVLSYSFDVRIQIPKSDEESSLDTTASSPVLDGVFTMDTPAMTPEVIIAPISPSAFNYSDPDTDSSMQETDTSAAISKDFSDPSTSEDSSLTGSDRTLVVDNDAESGKQGSSLNSPEKSPHMPNGSPLIKEENFDEAGGDTVENIDALKQKYYFRVAFDKRSEDGDWRILSVRLDRMMPMKVFSSLIKDLTGIDERKMVVSKVYSGCDFEVLNFNNRFNMLEPFDEIKCTLGHRLQKGEGRVGLYIMQMSDVTMTPVYVKDIVLHEAMAFGDVKTVVKQTISGMNLSVDMSNIRLRKKTKNGPSRILKDDQQVGEVLGAVNGSEIILQVLEAADTVEEYHSLFIRRWHPSTWTLDNPQEVLVEQDYTRPANELVLEKLCEVLDIKRESLQVAKTENHGAFPYQLNPIVIQERLQWFAIQTRSSHRSLYLYSDELFLFVRDRTETCKPLSPEERQQLEKELGTSDVYDFTASPRRETGLIINLARTPPA